ARYYNVEVADVDWFSIIFFLASLVVGFLSIAILDTFGLRVSVSKEWQRSSVCHSGKQSMEVFSVGSSSVRLLACVCIAKENDGFHAGSNLEKCKHFHIRPILPLSLLPLSLLPLSQLYLGAGLNLLGSVLRYLSTLDPIVCSSVFSRSGFTVAMIGQFLTACAQPFLLYSPTKLASFWFGPKERAICTNFASIANPIGLAVAQLASPYIVTSTERIPMMVRYSSSFFSPSLIFAREKSLHYLRF
ncbi:Solute carrier family 49 member A3, partial [Geodia barretti]